MQSPSRGAVCAGRGTRPFARSITVVATTIETRITTSTALTTDSPNSPIWKPTMVAASVAAACGVVSANTSAPSAAASEQRAGQDRGDQLAADAGDDEEPGELERLPLIITDGLSSSPTETRNMGTNTAEPKKSIRSISGPSLGTSRLSDSPAKKAPTIPSIPKISPTVAAARNPANVST